jgi:hypothetical protein
MTQLHPADRERSFAGPLEAIAHYLIRGGVWLSVMGIGCAGLMYATTRKSPPEHADEGALVGVVSFGSVALGIALLVLGFSCRGVTRLFKNATGTALQDVAADEAAHQDTPPPQEIS